MSLMSAVATDPGEGRTVNYGNGSSAELKIDGAASGGAYAVVEWTLHAGNEPPIHTHTREDETIYVLSGAITAFVGDQEIDVVRGSYVALPRGVPHGLRVHGDRAKLLVTLTPSGTEYFLVARDENDYDPTGFGLEIVGPVPGRP
jgi:quercetin dioxygenase-like cupin family protein